MSCRATSTTAVSARKSYSFRRGARAGPWWEDRWATIQSRGVYLSGGACVRVGFGEGVSERVSASSAAPGALLAGQLLHSLHVGGTNPRLTAQPQPPPPPPLSHAILVRTVVSKGSLGNDRIQQNMSASTYATTPPPPCTTPSPPPPLRPRNDKQNLRRQKICPSTCGAETSKGLSGPLNFGGNRGRDRTQRAARVGTLPRGLWENVNEKGFE